MKEQNILKKKGVVKAVVFVTVLIVLALLSKQFGWDLMDKGNLARLQHLVQQNILLASLIYVVGTMVGSVLLALPGVSFAIVAVVVFGPWLGTLLCAIAATAGAVASFLAGRYFLKDAIEPMIRKNEHLEKLLLSGSNKNAMLLLMITRLLPIFPYNLQNFAYGITDIKLLPFTLYSFIFMLPGTAMFTLGTAGIANPENRSLYLLLALGLAVIVFGSSFVLKKWMAKEQ